MDNTNRYTRMQQDQYDADASRWSLDNRDPVVGTFDLHNAWEDYDTHLFKDVAGDTLANQIVLDFGCGPGRNLVKFNKLFRRMDGVDISAINLTNAQKWVEANNCLLGNLYKNNGIDLQEIADNTYDVVMSTICFQHICVYDIRKNYLKEFLRVLKSGGTLTMQMGYGGKPGAEVPYTANNLDASGTNGTCDVAVRSPNELWGDLSELGFTDFNYYIRPVGPGDGHANWIFFSAKKP